MAVSKIPIRSDGSYITSEYISDLNVVNRQFPQVKVYLTYADTLHTPYKAGLTVATMGLCLSMSTSDRYMTQIWLPYADVQMFMRYGTPGPYFSEWKKFQFTT